MPFNGHMLSLARQIRKISQGELVESLDGLLTQGTLSKIERGRIQPSDEIVESFAETLSFQQSFFYDDAYVRQPPVSYHRKRKKILSKDISSIHGYSELLRISLEKCLEAVDLEHSGPKLPILDLDQFDGDSREAARATRSCLRLPKGPVRNLSVIVENSSVIIIPFNFGTTLIDGFCQHPYGSLPAVIFINTLLPIDRLRFSLAHELGHLVCHDVPNPEQEIQANQFASEFLMPSSDIFDDLRDFSLNKAMELKLYWGTSMQSLIHKAWELGRISDSRYKNCFIEMSRRGWRKNEPVEARGFDETPCIFSSIMETFIDGFDYSEHDVAELFGINLDDLHFYFPIKRRKPMLRVVASN